MALTSLLAKAILPLLDFTELSYEAEMYSHHGGRVKRGWDQGEEKDLALEAATEHPQTWRSWSCQAGGHTCTELLPVLSPFTAHAAEEGSTGRDRDW